MSEIAPPEFQPNDPPPAGVTISASYRRVLIFACIVPVLAMIVIGASRFDAILAISVRPTPTDLPDDGIPLINVRATPTDRQLIDETPYASSAADAATASAGLPERGVAMRTVRTVIMEVTAYCPCQKCCGKDAHGVTASGKPVTYNNGRFVAADTRRLPFGTMLRIPNYNGGQVVEVIDRGGAIKGDRLDVYFPDHQTARKWGRQMIPVQVVEPMEMSDIVGDTVP